MAGRVKLGRLGISFRNLAVIAGGLSVGLGFGLQNIVNNFIGGLILLFGRSIQPGDLVEIENIRGHVRKVTIRNTLVFSLRLWIKGWADRYADSEVRYHIDRIFRENNLEISFPKLDLHIRSAEGLKDLPPDNPHKR